MKDKKEENKSKNKTNKTEKTKNTTKTTSKNKEKDIKKLEKQKKKEDKKKNRKHPKLWLAFKIFIIIVLLLLIAGIAAFCGIFFSDKWSITKEQLLSDKGLQISDLNGNIITTLTGDEISKKVTLSEMSKLPDAFIAIEDKRFYEHGGVDIIRTANAIFSYGISVITGKEASFGGSTITQQLVKITMNDDARSGFAGIERKIREWSRAMQVEKMLDKDQILERYLNRIYLGQSGSLEVRGVESAANYYFSKKASELDNAECAFLAGINHSPNNYDPFNESVDNSEEIKSRTKTVLYLMKEQGKISEEEYNSAVEKVDAGLTFTKGSASNGNNTLSYHASAAINQVSNELSQEEDISYSEAREILINSGYTIYTTVDTGIQSAMEAEFKDSSHIVSSKGQNIQAAMCMIEPSTGYVVAEVGGLGENQDTLGLNRGVDSARQPGSSFKPLVTVAPGLENGVITASTLFDDSITTFGTNYEPKNDSNKYLGIATMRDIIKHSSNVPEVKLLSLLGIDKSVEFLSKIDINIPEESKNLALALGTPSVTPLQMAAGYAMLANGGIYITPTFYTKVIDQNGNTVIEAKQEKTRVMTEGNAYIETSILEGPINGGTAYQFKGVLGNMAVAGKTGTTDDKKDRWFCGYTPYYAAACWYGYDQAQAINVWGSNPAARIWFPVMKEANSSKEVKDFTKPDNIVSAKICKDSGKKATSKCKNTYTEIFVEGTVPEECSGHTTLKICKETNKIATEFCTDTEEKVYTEEIDTEKAGNWKTKKPSGGTKPPEDICDVHTKAPDINVPNVVGKTKTEAQKTLESAGFKVKILEDEDTSKKKDIVLKQSTTKASKGSTISITVNVYNGGGNSGTNNNKNTISNNETAGSNTNTTTGGNQTAENKVENTSVANKVRN